MAYSTTLAESMVESGALAQRVIAVNSAGVAGFTPAQVIGTVAAQAPFQILAASATTSYVEAFPALSAGTGHRILIMDNTDTSYLYLSLDGGTTLWHVVFPGKSQTLDLAAAGEEIYSAIHYKRFGTAGAGSYCIQTVR